MRPDRNARVHGREKICHADPEQAQQQPAARPRRAATKSHRQRLRAQNAAAVVGVDAGKFVHALVVRPRGEPDSRPLSFRTDRKGFEKATAFIDQLTSGAPPEEVLIGIEFAGVYGFTLAHYLDRLGYPVVSVLPAHTKRWKEVVHGQALKSDEKDAANIADLVAQGRYAAFPFLEPIYAELRYLVRDRDTLVRLINRTVSQLKSRLQIVFPEFESVFKDFSKKTPLAVLEAFPTASAVLEASPGRLLRLLKNASRGQCGAKTRDALVAAARASVSLPGADPAGRQIRRLIRRMRLYRKQQAEVEREMEKALRQTPEGPHLLTVPMCAPVTASVFLGLVGSPRAYESSRQIVNLAGLHLTSDQSGTRRGLVRLSKRGKPALRRQLFMFTLRNVRSDGIFRNEFLRLTEAEGRSKKEAIVILERKAARLLFSIANERRDYAAEPPAHSRGRGSRRWVVD